MRSGAPGWTTCSESPCPASLTSVKDGGRDGGTAVRFHGEGKGTMSAGWHFERRGAFTLDDALTMWLRVEAQSVADAPPIDGTWVSIYRGSMQASRQVLIDDCIADFADGEAHRVVIPISALYSPGDGFDPQIAEGIIVTVMSSTGRNFDIFVDDIKLETIDPNTLKTLCQPGM